MTDQDWRKHAWRPRRARGGAQAARPRIERNADAPDLAPGRQQPAEPVVVTKAAPARAAAAATPGNEWSRLVSREIRREANQSSRAMTKAIARVLLDEEEARQARDHERAAELKALRVEIKQMRERLNAIEAAKGAPAKGAPARSVVSLVG
jgi:hypothetical protein